MAIFGIEYLRLESELKKHKAIVIYGAGEYGREVCSFANKIGVTIDYVVVTDREAQPKKLNELEVFCIDDKADDIIKNNKAVFISIGWWKGFNIEVEEKLKSLNILNYYQLESFFKLNPQRFNKLNVDETVEYVVSRMSSLMNTPITADGIKNTPLKNNNKVAFVVGNETPRVLKIAKALKKKGLCLEVFFTHKEIVNEYRDKEREELVRICDKSKSYECLEELIYELSQSDAGVIHVFPTWGCLGGAYVLIKNKELFSPIVFDQYDYLNELFLDIKQEELDMERYCMENAAGLCGRSFELDYLLFEKNYKYTGKYIKFFDYCNDDFKDIVPVKKKDDVLRLCYVGTIYVEKKGLIDPLACHLDFARMCEENGAEYHVYPAVWDEKEYKELIDYSNNSKSFFFHHPINYSKLIVEIGQCDYTISPARRNVLGKNTNYKDKIERLVYGCSNKYFDGLDAFLPIIGTIPVKMIDWLSDSGVVLKRSIEDIDFDELRSRKDELKENVIRVREELRLENKIDELIEFYRTL